MTAGMDMAAVAALVGDPGRANMLAAMMDGRPHPAGELAELAGVTAPTASGHLARLVAGRLVRVSPQGRHRYYRLATGEVAQMLEGIMRIAATPTATRRATPRIDPALRRARTCYDHLAGELGVGIADALVARGVVELNAETASVTGRGRATLAAAGIALEDSRRTRRIACRPCLDWSERRSHLAGVLGAALLERALKTGLVRRRQGSRALDVNAGVDGHVLRHLGIDGAG